MRWAPICMIAVAACKGDAPPDVPAKPVDAAVAAIDATVAPVDARACEPLAVEIPELAIKSKLDAPLQDLALYGNGMDAFFEKLARLERGEPVTVRIGMYGDSNLANDRTPGDLRRRMQPRWGDAGHGWVSFGKPWGWYQHMDLRHGVTGTWSSFNLSHSKARDHYYGFAGTAAESTQVGATAWVATAKPGSPVGGSVSRFELFYLVRPEGGTFEVLIDKEVREEIESVAETPALKIVRYEVPDGPHELAVRVKSGRVRVFGVALERAQPGIVIDSLGVGSLTTFLLDTMDRTQTIAGLAARDYDLIVEATGSNMCIPRHLPKWIARVHETWGMALPKVGVLLWSPPDAARFGVWTSDPMMRECSKVKRAIAEHEQVAYWDLYQALGGDGSMPRWLTASRYESWVEPDGLHLGPTLNKYIGERFMRAVLAELARRATANPSLGCQSGQPSR